MPKSEKTPTDYKADEGGLIKSVGAWPSPQSVVLPHEMRITWNQEADPMNWFYRLTPGPEAHIYTRQDLGNQGPLVSAAP